MVRLDRRIIFRDRQSETDKAIHVAVCHVMHRLPHRPAAFVIGLWFVWGLLLPVKPGDPKFVLLKPGWSTKHIANELQANGVIRSARAFLLYHYIMKPRTLKAGEYKFADKSTAFTIHDRLV